VAAAAGVSQTTVSLVLNGRSGHVSEVTRQKVLAAADAMGYHRNTPARQLASGVTNTIGLVVRQSSKQLAGDPFLGATLHGLASVARASGYRVVVESIAPGEATYESLLRAQDVDGLVISGPLADDLELKRLVADGFPIVIHGSRPDLAVPSVDVDNVAGARLATEHLIALGHRRIACVIFDLSFVAARERLQGYQAALRDAGIAVDDGLIVETGYRVGTQSIGGDVLARDDYTAVFAAADMTAAGVLGALRSAGRRVPSDTSLVGFDDIPLAEFLDPPLTTVRVPAVEVGEAVGRALLDRLAGQTEVRRILLPVELMVRASSAPPPNRPQVTRDRGPRSAGSQLQRER
jgi:DNA-binding LacI/PurR family transcriptional regulator